MKALTISVLYIILSLGVFAQEERKLARKGNKEYSKQSYQKAELSYRKALAENPDYPEGQFNLGDAIYQQERYEEAVRPFEQILAQTESEEMKAWTHHNLGNTHLEAKKYDQAIDSYKSALRIRPDDMDTKYNLAYAQQMLDQQQQSGGGENEEQEDEQQQDQQNNNEQNQEQQQEQQDSNEEGNEQEEQNQNEGNEEKDGQQEQQQQQSQQPNQLSKEEAARILEALEAEEQKVQAKVQKEKGKPVKISIEKDW